MAWDSRPPTDHSRLLGPSLRAAPWRCGQQAFPQNPSQLPHDRVASSHGVAQHGRPLAGLSDLQGLEGCVNNARAVGGQRNAQRGASGGFAGSDGPQHAQPSPDLASGLLPPACATIHAGAQLFPLTFAKRSKQCMPSMPDARPEKPTLPCVAACRLRCGSGAPNPAPGRRRPSPHNDGTHGKRCQQSHTL
jgi:hypothetical protein